MKDCFKLSRFINIDNYEPTVKRLKITELLNKSFLIKKCIRYDSSKWNKPFYRLTIELNNKDYVFNTGSVLIVAELDDLTKHFTKLDEINVYVKLINKFGNYKLIDGDIDECANI